MEAKIGNKSSSARANKYACKALLRDALHDAAVKRQLAKSAAKKVRAKEGRLAKLSKKLELLQSEVSRARACADQATAAAAQAQTLVEQRLAETRLAAEALRHLETTAGKTRKAAGAKVSKTALKIAEHTDKPGGKQTRGCASLV